MWKYTGILNGDFFRSQADNMQKFADAILSDKTFNSDIDMILESGANNVVNFAWIEYLYFKLYFKENPNKKIDNVNYAMTNRNTDSLINAYHAIGEDLIIPGNIPKSTYGGEPPLIVEDVDSPQEEDLTELDALKRQNADEQFSPGHDNKPQLLLGYNPAFTGKDFQQAESEFRGHINNIMTNRGRINTADSNLLQFDVGTNEIGDKMKLIKDITKVFIDLLGEVSPEIKTVKTAELDVLIKTKFETVDINSGDCDDASIHLYLILSAYTTAYYEYIAPEKPADTDSWWFFEKRHFESIVTGIDIIQIFTKYNSLVAPAPVAEANLLPDADADAEDEVNIEPRLVVNPELQPQVGFTGPRQLPQPVAASAEPVLGGQGGNKTHRFRYKTQSGKHTRSARW
jgi:hypothetical protein